MVPVHDEADGKEVKKKSGDNNELEQKWKQLEFITGVTTKIKKDDAFTRSRSISESSKDSSHDRSSDLEFLSLSETRSIPAHETKLTPDGGKQMKDELERLSKVQVAMVKENEFLLNQNEELKDEVKALTKTVDEQSRYMRQIENGEIIVRRGKIVFDTPSNKNEDSNKHRDSDESSIEGRGQKKHGSDDAEDSEINESESDDECGFATITGGGDDDDNEEDESREHLFKIKHQQKRHKQLKIENEELKKEIDLLKKKKQTPAVSGHRESKNAELMSTNLELIAEKEHMEKELERLRSLLQDRNTNEVKSGDPSLLVEIPIQSSSVELLGSVPDQARVDGKLSEEIKSLQNENQRLMDKLTVLEGCIERQKPRTQRTQRQFL